MAWSKAEIEKRRREIVGKRFGKLLVLEFVSSNNKRMWYKCQCDCGKVITRRKDTLNGTNSCGCDQSEKVVKAHATRSRKATGDKITYDMLIDKDPYEAIQMIKGFCEVDYYKGKEIYSEWRKRFRIDPTAYISKLNK